MRRWLFVPIGATRTCPLALFRIALHERPFARSLLARFFSLAERPGGPLCRGRFTYPCRVFPKHPLPQCLFRPGRSAGNATRWLILCRNALGQSVTHSLKGNPDSRYGKYAHCRGPERRKSAVMLRDSRKKCDVQQSARRIVASAGHSPLTASCPPYLTTVVR